jgi:hypothetical protein
MFVLTFIPFFAVRVFLDEEDPLIQKIGIPLSFSVKLEENMRTPQLR